MSLVVECCGIKFHVAPMQGYTNCHLNFLLRQLAPECVLWTEMEKTEDLLARGDDALLATLDAGGEDAPPPILQLGGDDARDLRDATRRACALRPLEEINLNCGCPGVATGGGKSYGASLMRRAAHVRTLVEAVRDAAPPSCAVSVKCRAGVVDTFAADEDEDDAAAYDEVATFVAEASSSGALDHVVVHCRAAVLAGLSPGANRERPRLRPDVARRLAVDFPRLRVTRNGGLAGYDDDRRDVGLDGVMAGRLVLKRPLDVALRSEASTSNRATALDAYARYVRASDAPPHQLAVPLVLALEQLRDEVRSSDDDGAGCDAMAGACRTLGVDVGALDSGADLRRLSKTLSKLIGKKVYSKVLRNRNEAARSGLSAP